MPKTSRTKLLLAESLQQLMLTMPLEKISVNDIVEKAGVGRNTFYYHFADKYDLVTWYFQTGITPFLFEHTKYGSWQSLLIGLEEYFRQNKVFYKNALAYTGQNSLMEYILFMSTNSGAVHDVRCGMFLFLFRLTDKRKGQLRIHRCANNGQF